MTKEPIMIDDVDVSGCIHRIIKNEFCTYCNAYSSKVFDFDCSDFPTCYYKQLKRKEQECEAQREEKAKYRSALEEIREDMEQDTTCESRECGCDDYAECLNCIKETILNKISEVEDDR